MTRRALLRVLPALAYTVAIFYGGTIDLHMPELEQSGGDKVLHLLAFGGLELVLELALLDLKPAARRLWAVAGASALGLALELVQAALPYRSADVLDWLADTVGAVLGGLSTLVLARVLSRAGPA